MSIENFNVKWHLDKYPAIHILRVKLPDDVVGGINKYIDEQLIPYDSNFGKNKGNIEVENSYAEALVGQIRQNKKSAQLDYRLLETFEGKKLKVLLDQCCNMYLKQIEFPESLADVFESWSIHSYAGDYNPMHDHGVRTKGGLSMILYLKVPECIEKIANPNTEPLHLKSSSGNVDGFTYLNWSNINAQLYEMLYPPGEIYVKPEVGLLMVFPNWLKHAVMPFFGEGERRTLSANANIIMKQYFDFENEPKEKLQGLLTKLRKSGKEMK
tara:strand:- start:1272 stop:2078 length:807 start_codon:yes stop_codon:yes gene_type:complete